MPPHTNERNGVAARADRLREARERAGLTLGQAAKQLGTDRATLGMAEGEDGGLRRGAAAMTLRFDACVAAAELYDVDVRWLQGLHDGVVPPDLDAALRVLPDDEQERIRALVRSLPQDEARAELDLVDLEDQLGAVLPSDDDAQPRGRRR